MPANAPWLPKRTLALVDRGVAALREVYEERLLAAALVGAAASPARHDRTRTPEVLAIVRETSVPLGKRLAQAGGSALRDGLRIRVLTADELSSSSDVFTLEIAEWRDRHVLLAGEDPFDGITIAPADLRRSLEQAARGLSRQLRNRLIAAEATDGKRGSAQFAVAMAVERCVELAHHALQLAGERPPLEEAELLAAFARRSEVDPDPVVALLSELRGSGQLADPWGAFETLAPLLDGAKRGVDRLAPEAS